MSRPAAKARSPARGFLQIVRTGNRTVCLQSTQRDSLFERTVATLLIAPARPTRSLRANQAHESGLNDSKVQK